jgi:hypothetical protein
MLKQEALRHFFHHSKDSKPLECDDCREALKFLTVPGYAESKRSQELSQTSQGAREKATYPCDESKELFKDCEYVRARERKRFPAARSARPAMANPAPVISPAPAANNA